MQDVFTGKVFRTRSGAVVIGVIAAALAAILLVVYLKSYRSSVKSGSEPMNVLVAKQLIPKGTSGLLIAQQHLYQVTSVPKSQLKALAIADPGTLNGEVTAADVYPGQQLTAEDFAPIAANSIPAQITGTQRAIAISVDSTHSVGGQVQTGDRVDIYVGLPTESGKSQIKLFASNVLVLAAPGTGGGNEILRIRTAQAAKFAFMADNGRIWLVLRPQSGSSKTPPSVATLGTLVSSPPVSGG